MRLRPCLFLAAIVIAVGCGKDPVEPPVNKPPHIQGIVAIPEVVAREGLTRITVLASDPDDDPLTYRWSAPAGSFTDSSEGVIRWKAPNEAGIFPIKVVISDGAHAESTSVNIGVGSGSVFVDSDPPGLPIVLNGETTGKVTPDSLRRLPVSEYTVEVGSSYFQMAPSETSFVLEDGEIVSIRFRTRQATTEVVNTGPGTMDEIGGLTYLDGGIGVLYAVRTGSDTTLRSASLLATSSGNGRILDHSVELHEPLTLRNAAPDELAFVRDNRITIAPVVDLNGDGLVEELDTLIVLQNGITESFGPAFSRDGEMIGYALSPSTPPNDEDFLLVAQYDSAATRLPHFAASTRKGNSLHFGPEPFAIFEWGGEIWEVEIDPVQSFPPFQLSDTDGNVTAPAYSPDGRFIAYIDRRGGLKILAPGIGKTITVLQDITASRVAWSPNGLEILVADNRQPGNAKLLLVYNLPIR
jgi:hypothetical protein